MNYKVLNKNFDKLTSEEFLTTILQQRGVDDVHHLLNVSEKDLCDTMKFRNIKEGLNLFDYWMSQDACHIHIIFDTDTDGCTSGEYMFDYIKKVNPSINVTCHMNEGKKHGIDIKEIPNIETIDFLIVPDAGSSDISSYYALNDKGIDVLILDHHEFKLMEDLSIEEAEQEENNYKELVKKYNIDCDNEEIEKGKTVIINNQDGQYENKTLSGVGVCYKFCKEYDKGVDLDYADDNLDLVAIGMIADSVDLRNYETRFLINKGLNNINNDLIKEILYKTGVWDKNVENNKQVTIEDIGWKVAPQVNGTIREGTKEDKELMIKAFNGEKQDFEYQPRRKKKTDPKPPIEIHSLQQEMARIMCNIKTKQTKKVKDYMNKLDEEINKTLKEGDKIIVVDSSDLIEENTYTGLVANKLASKYKRPCLVLRDNGNEYGGSGRNYSLNEIESLKDDLETLNLFNKLAGHSNAMGIGIDKDKIEEMKEKFNEAHKDMKIEDTHLCDFEILSSKLRYKDVLEIAKLRPLWGGDIKEPQFVLPNVTVKAEQITRHSNNKWNIIELPIANSKKIKVYQTQNAGEEGYNKLLMREGNGFNNPPKMLKMDLVVKMKMWEIEGQQYPYLQLVDYNVEKGRKARW